MVTTAFASAVPLSVGVLSLVEPPLGTATLVTSLVTIRFDATGTPVSIISVTGVAVLTLPAASVAVTLRLCVPSASVELVMLHAPVLLAVVEPSTVAPSRTMTTLPASAVPLSAGVLSLVLPPLAMAIGVEPLLLLAATVTAPGAVVSMMTLADVVPLTLPAASVTVTLNGCVPTLSAVVVKLHVPSDWTMAVPSTVVPSEMVTRPPASAVLTVPLSVGVVSLVEPPFGTVTLVTSLVITKVEATGATVSTVIGKLVAVLVLPAASVTVTLSGCAPLESAAVVKVHAPPAPAITVPSTVVPS